MSAKRLSLSGKPTIAIVVVLLVAVGALNFRTFSGSGRARSDRRSAVRMQSAPPYPSDLAAVVQSSASPLTGLDALRGDLPALARDPFIAGKGKPVTVATAGTTTKRRNAGKALRCDAVFPGGRDPQALIRGKMYRVGDKVAGLRLSRINVTGVDLVDAAGKQRFLPVGTQADEQGTSRVITSLPGADQGGTTRLVEYEKTERKLP